MRNKTEMVWHILTARIDHATDENARIAYCNVLEVFEYFLTDNIEGLRKFDYLLTKKECGLE